MAVVGNVLIHPYQMQRVKNFLDPWGDPLGNGYHVVQSMIAVGAGGLFGVGLGQSRAKFFYLPNHYTDFIFSIICEEGGFIFGTIVILLIALFFIRGLKIGADAGNDFGYYLAICLTNYLVFQAAINIGTVISVFPATGIPLTFISFGGTSLIMSLFSVGVILNISRHKPRDTSLDELS